MRIVIDARMYNESGIGRYTRNLIEQLQKLDDKNEYFVLLLNKDFETLEFQKNFKKVLADFKWYGLAEQRKLPKILYQIEPDLVHFPHFNVPIFYKDKFVVTIHDLIHQHHQMKRSTALNPLIYKIKQFGYNKVFKNAISKSIKILVPSSYVRDLLINEWKLEKEKIVVTYEGVDDKILSLAKRVGKVDLVKKKFNIKPPYIFYVGNAHPHKNVEGLIKAFLKLRKSYQYLQLVLSGNDHYFWQRIKKEYNHKDIIYTGFVSDEELVSLYKKAKVFVMPSFEEGFGIPLLEAFVCGTPVVSSNVASLPEISRDAAIYFNPKDTDDMVDKISKVLNSEKLRKDLIKKGQKRVKEFSWQELAKKTQEVYLDASSAGS